MRPGIVPLRPLSLSDIFNGATVYIRANPRVTLGLTATVIVTTQLVSLAASAAPLVAADQLRTAPRDELTGSDIGAWSVSAGLSAVVSWLGGIVLTGMLAVLVGRAVFGETIGAGQAWSRIRPRLPALFGLAAAEAAGLILLAGGVGVIIGVTIAAGNVAAAVLLGFPLVLTALAAVTFGYVALTFAPVVVTIEGLPVFASIERSFALVHNSFWRILGIRALTLLVVTLIAGTIAAPFELLGQLAGGAVPQFLVVTAGAIGAVIGRLVTAPFSAGVVTLLYTDRRIRCEAIDLVLSTDAAGKPGPSGPGDYLWSTRQQ